MAVSVIFVAPCGHLTTIRTFRSFSFLPKSKLHPVHIRASSSISETEARSKRKGKKIFVAGATGKTGKRIVEQLLSKGFAVKAGVRDVERAKSILSGDNPLLEIAKADVTEGSTKLSEAISNDIDAVICSTGFYRSLDLVSPWKINNFGTVNLVEACRKQNVKRFILISSILVNGAAMGQLPNPACIILNLIGLTLVAKLQAENHIRKSGMNYTIIRPGGLTNDPPKDNIVMEPEDTLYGVSISRDQVAQVAVERASLQPESNYKVVEIAARMDASERSLPEIFSSIQRR